MKTSSCSSRSDKPRKAPPAALFAGVVLTLQSFGPVPDLLKEENPWVGFKDDAPVLTVLRAQKVPAAAGGKCAPWVSALEGDRLGHATGSADSPGWVQALKHWEPWKEEDIEGIESCDRAPCDVKLNDAEAVQMASVEPKARRQKFFALVQARAQRYQKTQERKAYEFAGDPVDPWKRFAEQGLKSPLAMGARPELWARRLDFFPGRLRAIRQILDSRFAVSADRREATLWRRDAYTDHYFDSWGEWTHVSCDADSVTVVQALLIELDLMKKSDLVSKLMRSKMRGAVKDNGAVYLKQGFERLKTRASREAGEGKAVATAVTGR
jgi:hypothetical protein